MSGDWCTAAACRGQDPALFFGPDGETAEARQEREAKAGATCAECPVRPACLDYAITTGQKAGVWGGAGEDERAAMCRRLRAQRKEAA